MKKIIHVFKERLTREGTRIVVVIQVGNLSYLLIAIQKQTFNNHYVEHNQFLIATLSLIFSTYSSTLTNQSGISAHLKINLL